MPVNCLATRPHGQDRRSLRHFMVSPNVNYGSDAITATVGNVLVLVLRPAQMRTPLNGGRGSLRLGRGAARALRDGAYLPRGNVPHGAQPDRGQANKDLQGEV